MKKDNILVIGANGQIGSELTLRLRDMYGPEQVFATDIKEANSHLSGTGPFELLNVLERPHLAEFVKRHEITQVYLMAALLSATAEKYPADAWQLNMEGLFNTITVALDTGISKMFWPSSIAAFGPHSPKLMTPQYTVMDPNTVYGISKLAGEGWCRYYFEKKGLDIRSLRYPGLISYLSPPGGGTTDYAVAIFYEALKSQKYSCFLKSDTRLPMMYMPDAIDATIKLMEAPSEDIRIRTSYNVSAIDFTPKELAAAIQKHIAGFEIEYAPDFRQEIAAGWPQSIDDQAARNDWGWKQSYDLDRMVSHMLTHIQV